MAAEIIDLTQHTIVDLNGSNVLANVLIVIISLAVVVGLVLLAIKLIKTLKNEPKEKVAPVKNAAVKKKKAKKTRK